jgi:hypothetical protein
VIAHGDEMNFVVCQPSTCPFPPTSEGTLKTWVDFSGCTDVKVCSCEEDMVSVEYVDSPHMLCIKD